MVIRFVSPRSILAIGNNGKCSGLAAAWHLFLVLAVNPQPRLILELEIHLCLPTHAAAECEGNATGMSNC
jgi:hypothetical protein